MFDKFFSASLTDCPMKAERRSSTTRKAHEAELDDILGIFDSLDSQSVLGGIKFHSTALDRLPGAYVLRTLTSQ